MKSALIFVVAISGIIGVYSSSAARGTHAEIIRTPTVPEPSVERSVSSTRSPSLAASDAWTWGCIVVNPTGGAHSVGYGPTEAQALATARNRCGNDCTLDLCEYGGCLAYAGGPKYVQIYTGVNHGSLKADLMAAQNGALAGCQAHSTGCTIKVTLCTSNPT
jgi:hypothetical protein